MTYDKDLIRRAFLKEGFSPETTLDTMEFLKANPQQDNRSRNKSPIELRNRRFRRYIMNKQGFSAKIIARADKQTSLFSVYNDLNWVRDYIKSPEGLSAFETWLSEIKS